MEANKNTLLRLLDGNDKEFIIPVYQRPYSWKKENCVQLMKDLRDVCTYGYKSHFFGSIVFVSQNNGVCAEHIIIDGQQRLTTVSLLLLAIRNYVNENKDAISNINPRKITSYLTDEFADDEKKLKLKLVQGDDDAYNKLIQSKSPVADNSITANYDYFYSQIEKMPMGEIEELFNAISKLDIVSISLKPEDGDDPQLIFESMNSTGLDLEPSDKIRNYVLMRMSAKEQDRFYKKYWEPLEELVDRKDITKFFRYYLDVKLRRNVAEKKLYAYRKVHEALFDLDPTIYHAGEYTWFKKKGKDFKKAHKIGKDGYIETNRNSQQKMDSIKLVAEAMQLSSEDIQYSVVSESDLFSLEDEKTYKNVTVGKLAFAMFKYVLENGLISEEEVELLKTKEYTKQLFNKTDYPILADTRDANRGNSKVLRYRAESVKFGDKQIYVTFQWFDGNRDDIINWFKAHKK